MKLSLHQLFQNQVAGGDRKARTRALVLDSAISVIASKGSENTTVGDVAKQAGIVNGTFYNHFDDKAQLLREVANGIVLEIAARIDDEISDIENAPTRVIIATAKLMDIAKTEPDWVKVFFSGADTNPEIRTGFVLFLKGDLELGAKQGHFTVPVDALLINQVIAVMRAAMLLDKKRIKKPTQKTCTAIMRLTGISVGRAEKLVAKALGKYSHLIA